MKRILFTTYIYLIVTICYPNSSEETRSSYDTVQNEKQNFQLTPEFLKKFKDGTTPSNNPFGLEASATDLNGFTGENMDYLTGYEDYTNYNGKDYTGSNYSIEDLQKENRNAMFFNIVIKLGLPLLALFAIYYLLKETIWKKTKENINDEENL